MQQNLVDWNQYTVHVIRIIHECIDFISFYSSALDLISISYLQVHKSVVVFLLKTLNKNTKASPKPLAPAKGSKFYMCFIFSSQQLGPGFEYCLQPQSPLAFEIYAK